jgi:xanthine dehydrogenase accessory factor
MTIDAALREAASGPFPLALVTVASVEGSAPRHAGSRMAVRADGSIVGTVGGGKPEARAREEALSALNKLRNASLRIEMAGAEATGSELICGGEAEIWIEVLREDTLYPAAVAAVDGDEPVVLASSAAEGCLAVLGPGDKLLAGSASFTADSIHGLEASAIDKARESRMPLLGEAADILYMPIEPPERLLILGGGHVGLALAREAQRLSFHITVADPRPEFSEASRFPPGVTCRTEAFEEAIANFPFGGSAYIVIVSPGHLGDLECARAVIQKEYRYAGFIGSRRKSRMLIDELKAEGFEAEKAEALRAPIGLDIGAETPEEIAVAIAAELVAVRHDAASLDRIDAERRLRRGT